MILQLEISDDDGRKTRTVTIDGDFVEVAHAVIALGDEFQARLEYQMLFEGSKPVLGGLS